MASIKFTGNYQDLSTDKGYQFKFCCEKCGNGHLSTFKTSTLGMASSALRAAGNLFGGVLGSAANSAYEIQRAVGGTAHDAALKEAAEEISKEFKQCSRCGKWVCGQICWNAAANLCESCAPDPGESSAAAQALAAQQEAQTRLNSPGNAAAAATTCPSCGAKLSGGKFCPECGTAIATKKRCSHCGVEAEGNPKFCPECGQKYG
jgi:membrane protease subunit (stomatin/prohibitin family)